MCEEEKKQDDNIITINVKPVQLPSSTKRKSSKKQAAGGRGKRRRDSECEYADEHMSSSDVASFSDVELEFRQLKRMCIPENLVPYCSQSTTI